MRSHYVGADRRAGADRVRESNERVLLVTLTLVLMVWGLLEVGAVRGLTIEDPVDTDRLRRLLDAAVVALGAVVSLLAFVRWRLTGEARPLWLGAAALVLGPLAIGAGDLLPTVLGGRTDPGLNEIRVAGRILGAVALLGAALWHPVDTRLRPRHVSGGVLAVAGLLALAFRFVPGVATAIRGDATNVALGLAWAVVALCHARAARHGDTISHETTAVAVAALALAEVLLVRMSAATVPTLVLAGTALLYTVAFVMLVGRGLRDLETAFVTQRARLLETEIGMEAEAARRRAEQHAHEERAHDARNALLAIEGAAVALERYRDRLDPERRAQLVEAVSGEIARLQNLIAAERQQVCQPFDLAELLGPVVASERARGLVVETDVPAGLACVGRPAETVEVVRNLLDNARRYAAGSPVTVRADVDGAWTVLYVEDRGRGVDRQERAAIFERGRRGRAASGTDGSGLGLFVSRRLMLEQQGDLWVESRQGGGASFGLCLPHAGTTTPEAPYRDRTENGLREQLEEVGRTA